jgi:hypothetical protein
MHRRHFLGAISTAVALQAQPTDEWGNPVLGIHLHLRLAAGMPNIAAVNWPTSTAPE